MAKHTVYNNYMCYKLLWNLDFIVVRIAKLEVPGENFN
jgi:hypothetical protein